MQTVVLLNTQSIDWRLYVSENDRNFVRDRFYECMVRTSQLRRSELRDVAMQHETRIWDYCESITEYRVCVNDLIVFFTISMAQPMQVTAVQNVQHVAHAHIPSHKRKPERHVSHLQAKWCRLETAEQMVD